MRRVPSPLLALCATALLLGVTWAIVTPAFQAPDENQHFAYAEYLARTGRLPGAADKPPFPTEQRLAGLASNSDQAAGALPTKMTWSDARWRAWQAKDDTLGASKREDGGGTFPATTNPPLYYAVEAIPARLTRGADIFTRLAWERIVSSLWAVVLVVFAWMLAGEVFGRDRALQFVAAGAAGLMPMTQFVSASVTPDAMLYAVWAAVFYTGTRILRHGLTPGRALVFLAAVGAACVVKATSYALLPGALLVLAIGAWRLREGGAKALLRLGAAGLGLVLTLGVWFYIAHRSGRAAAGQVNDATDPGTPLHVRDFLSYLWQYYLPQLPWQVRWPFPHYFGRPPFFDVVVRGLWGTFGWTEARFPQPMFVALAAFSGVLAAATLAALARFRRAIDRPVLAFFVVTAIALGAGLQWTDYHMILSSNSLSGFYQGRYLLPMAAVGGLCIAAIAKLLPARRRGTAIGAFVGALVVLNVYSLGLVAGRFYA